VNRLEFTALLWLGSVAAGLIGSLTGLGGGVILVPLLVLAFGVDIHYAGGAALVSVIATSSGAAAAYVREGYSNIRLGMFLEVATTVGAVIGAALAGVLPPHVLCVVFGLVLLASVVLSIRSRVGHIDTRPPDPLAARLRLDGSYPTPDGPRYYNVRHVPLGFALMSLAGLISGLLGIGSGAFKVLAMDQAMRIPFKASTTTSNFMIGVTAAASASIYLSNGWVRPGLAFPVVLGVLLGSMLGARLLTILHVRWLRIIFAVVIALVSLQMIYKGFTGKL
jgi:uncharacterized membrane protein YfcA